MNNNRIKILLLKLVVLLTGVFCAFSAIAAPVQVKVSEYINASGAIYTYRVVNGTTSPIVGVRIGFDYLHGVAQLHSVPSGWTLNGGLPESSVISPPGWTARLVTTEESPLVNMDWSSDQGPQFDIQPGASVSGFSVRLPQARSEYRTAAFDVILGDSTHVYGTLQPDDAPPMSDNIPPNISVSLVPNIIFPPNHKMVTISATITVSDNIDPNPKVRLESITCNETINPSSDIAGATFGTDVRQFSVRAERTGKRKDGRVYTVVYSATDNSGNKATATAMIRIPHDQRR